MDEQLRAAVIDAHPSQFMDTNFLMSVYMWGIDTWKFDARILNQPVVQFDYLPAPKGKKRLWKSHYAHIILNEPANRIKIDDGVVWWRSHRYGSDYFETGPTTRKLTLHLKRDVKWEGPDADKIQWTEEPFYKP